jgi:3,4-dihydroxy 2-butanone 4-phosphate synthase/GTP cyclohydrolase II
MSDAEEFEVLPSDPLRRVELAMEDLKQGRMVILVDDEDRENEGDIVIAAEMITPEAINFMATHARGLICLSLTRARVERLGLQMMASHNQSPYNTAFTVSIEAREGVTTGISAADRAHTVKVAIREGATSRDIVTPGHVFPLRAREGGVLERVGQTEGSVDLARLAGLDPSAVICEIMNPDGSMARLSQLREFGAEHRIRIVAVADVIKYRMQNERIVKADARGTLEIDGLGTWNTRLYRGITTEGLHLAIYKGQLGQEPTVVRVQGAPPAWTFLNPSHSFLAGPAMGALRRIDQEGSGVLVLMHLGGKSIDLLARAYLRDFNGEVQRGEQPRAEALRDLGAGCQILRDLGLRQLRILSGTSRPIAGVEAYGLEVVEHVELVR